MATSTVMATRQRVLGLLGVTLVVLTAIEVPLYFVGSDQPPDGIVLTRVLVNLVVTIGLMAFLLLLGDLLWRDHERWLASTLTGGIIAYAVVTLVANALEAGATIASTAPVDPTIAANGAYLLYGSIGRLLTALVLTLFAHVIRASGEWPNAVARSAAAIAALNLAFVPSLFFGNDNGAFYSANGWGTTAIASSALMYWVLLVSVLLLRANHRAPPDPDAHEDASTAETSMAPT